MSRIKYIHRLLVNLKKNFFFSFYFIYYYYYLFIYLLYNSVLVLPYISMNPPRVYTVCETAKETEMYRTVFWTLW